MQLLYCENLGCSSFSHYVYMPATRRENGTFPYKLMSWVLCSSFCSIPLARICSCGHNCKADQKMKLGVVCPIKLQEKQQTLRKTSNHCPRCLPCPPTKGILLSTCRICLSFPRKTILKSLHFLHPATDRISLPKLFAPLLRVTQPEFLYRTLPKVARRSQHINVLTFFLDTSISAVVLNLGQSSSCKGHFWEVTDCLND